MPSFNSFTGNNDNNVNYDYSSPVSETNLLTKVFGVMFISLLITAAASYGLGYLFMYFFNSGNDAGVDTLFALMGISSIGLLVMAFVMPTVMARGKHSLLPSYIIYLAFMSILLSTIFVEFEMSMIIFAFGATSVVFGIMALMGYLSKGSLRGTSMLVGGLFFGVIILSLINIFRQSDELSWIVSFGMFAIMLFITMLDVRRIKDIANSGMQHSYNLVLYGSFMLYLDFINIFLRLLTYIARFSDRN